MDKKIKVCPFKYDIKQITEEGEFEGYGSIFDDELDGYGDLVAKGAFEKTIKAGGRNRNGIAMLAQHDPSKIAGIWTYMAEDSAGLFVKGKIATKTTVGSDYYEYMKLGAIKGLSIGFNTVKYEIDKDRDCRILKEVELWEISLVTFPAKITANITAVKAIEDAKTERDLENALRESGLSKSAAQYLVKLCKPTLLRDSAPEEKNQSLKVLLESLKQVNNQYF